MGGQWVGPELGHSEAPSWTYKENHLHNHLPSPAPSPKWTKHFDSCNINIKTASEQCLIRLETCLMTVTLECLKMVINP